MIVPISNSIFGIRIFYRGVMRIIVADTKEEVALIAATLMSEQILRKMNSVIGLATGKTMEPVYEHFKKLVDSQKLDLNQLHFFMLDEYIGLDLKHSSSFQSYIKQRVLKPLNLSEAQFSFPPANLPEDSAGDAYEKEIEQFHGVDFQLLGVGRNGHIGFNEPGSERKSLTRVVRLTEDTREANQSDFSDRSVPDLALSMGIETIFRAKELVLIATGVSKADAIHHLMNSNESSECPVTFLKSHERFTLVLDREAASRLS